MSLFIAELLCLILNVTLKNISTYTTGLSTHLIQIQEQLNSTRHKSGRLKRLKGKLSASFVKDIRILEQM